MKAFVTGWPISHSKSPKLHGYWLKAYGILGTYEPLAIDPDAFPDFIRQLPNSEFVGGNITIPHKETAHDLIKNRSEAAEMIGAVNTLWTVDGTIYADNTDAYGFCANLDQFAPRWKSMKTATVLGAGGASRAIIHGLIDAGFKNIRIVNRTFERAKALSDRFGAKTTAHGLPSLPELLPDTELLVNTSSMGMTGENTSQVPDLAQMPKTSLVTDIVYTPLVTPLLEAAKKLELESVDGLGMLLHQAVPGFEKWFGRRPDVSQGLRSALLEES